MFENLKALWAFRKRGGLTLLGETETSYSFGYCEPGPVGQESIVIRSKRLRASVDQPRHPRPTPGQMFGGLK